MSTESPRFLLIDSYDSFTYNLADLCRKSIPKCCIHIIKNDQITLPTLISHLSSFSAIIVGPGPGSPDVLQDIGIVKDLWKLEEHNILPIFGVCLGLQSMAIEFGGRLKRLPVVKHGQVSRLDHLGADLFKGLGEVYAVRYHSLHVEVPPDCDIAPLAWADDEPENGRVIMSVRHKTKPFWAVQYHPESILTSGGGLEVMDNFWFLASAWISNRGGSSRPWDSHANAIFGPPWPTLPSIPASLTQCLTRTVATMVLSIPNLPVPDICELFGVSEEASPFVMLDSAAYPGQFCIIGCLDSASLGIQYFAREPFIRVAQHNSHCQVALGPHDIWTWLASFMDERKALGGHPHVPFWGGLIGYTSYELGARPLCDSLTSTSREHQGRHPDLNFAFVERSMVLDVMSGNIFVQSIIPNDEEWLTNTVARLNSAAQQYSLHTDHSFPYSTQGSLKTSTVSVPDMNEYKSRINIAKEHLFAGDSYELCLTARTCVTLHPPPLLKSQLSCSTSWQRYKRLRERNPAPHAAYIRLHPSTLLTSSPERFLSWTRSPDTTYQLRPIKGTLRKGPGITRAVAEKTLAGSTKEVAENLMIVDLIRHDLHGVIGQNVEVKQFCAVEEYKTVWQLVSVIEGQPPKGVDVHHASDRLAWEVLRQSLPPGSMTGAPKKRSVEILQTLEDGPRELYSGVFGYWCVGGGGDWSVTIRSCFKYDGRYSGPPHKPSQTKGPVVPPSDAEEWVIGAGGAITALSDADEEWEEMMVKLESVLQIFDAAAPRSL